MKSVRNKAFKDYKDGIKMDDIAAKYGVPFNTVKSWARRHWKLKKGEKGAVKSMQKVQPRPHGAPKGSQNNLIHGAYAKFSCDIFKDDENREFINHIESNPEQILKDILIFYKLREYRLLKRLLVVHRIEGMEFYIRRTYITYTKIDGKTEKTVTHIPSPMDMFVSLNNELAKIERSILEIALLLHKLQISPKVSVSTMKKIYSMVETAAKAKERIQKVIDQCICIPNSRTK